ncbi:MAG: MATE family efflux transporter, partial [Candidatus Gallimonas sp.]
MNFSSDGNKSVAKILLKTGIPMVLSMTLQALYNIVDSAFVSRAETGEAALNALTLAFPVQMLVIALGIGTGVGVNALLSRALGQGDADKANRAAGNGFFLAAVVYLIFLAFGLFFTGIYVRSQTDDAMIGAMAIEYLRINCILSFGVAFFSVCEKLLQATGRSLFSTIAQVAGAATNIVLDPIMIYGLLGLPALGVSGAAWATVIGQIVSFALALFFHCKFNREVRKKLSDCKPSGKIILQIYAIGLPAIIAQALTSVMTYGMNRLLVKLSPAYVTAYGLYYKIQQFVLFAAFGLRDAITPLVSYEYGRGDGMRVRAAIKWG